MKTPRDIIMENIGPPVNIEAIVRGFGIELDKSADLHVDIAGQIERIGDGKYKISANKNDHYFRRRFTIAHELSHFLLHRPLIGDGVDDNKAYRSTPSGMFYNSNITGTHETEANRLAARLLMPGGALKRLFGNGVDDAKELAKRFQVSPRAMAIRLEGLDLIRSDEPVPHG